MKINPQTVERIERWQRDHQYVDADCCARCSHSERNERGTLYCLLMLDELTGDALEIDSRWFSVEETMTCDSFTSCD